MPATASPKNESGIEKEQALFYQRRQWLKWNDSTRRWAIVKQNPDKPKPMPVTNYFAKAINDNANQLQKVTIVATPNDDDDKNRRGAEYAEKSIDAIDEESGFNVLRPLLAKHTVLWGMGITKDIFDTTIAGGQTVLANPTVKATWALSCADCGKTSDLGEKAPIGTPAGNMTEDADQNAPRMTSPDLGDKTSTELPGKQMPAGNQKCPLCGSATTTPYQKKTLVPAGTKTFTKGKIYTEIATVFDTYLPRDCRNPNLAKTVVQRYRKGLGQLRRMYAERAANIRAEAPHDVHEIYMEALRALVNYNYMHEQTIETTTVTEVWCDWDDVPKKLQDQLEQFWGNDPETLEQAINAGIFVIYAGGCMLNWGANPTWGEKPFTFFLWELDPASVYPKGASVDLTPLQKRLNRLDSLVELAHMCNAVGKWLWPRTQTGKPPSGSPNEVIPYDPIGEGKNKPEYVPATSPVAASAFQLRESIIADFSRIGNTLSVQQGQNQSGVKAFRAIAYLGSKAEESTGTQRMLWELGNQIRYKKVVRMAANFWDDNRKVKVAGYNGKFGMLTLTGQQMQGDYEITYTPDSSRPRLIGEKQQAVAAGLQAGLIDPKDPATREYLIDILRLDEVNLVDELQFRKAERDLETLKQGKVPNESPFQKWDIFLKVFANFTLTEEFEALDPQKQKLILIYTQRMSEQLAAANGTAPPPGALPPGAAEAAKAIANLSGGGQNPLGQIPGQQVGPEAVQGAAGAEGAQVGANLP